jgi:hypothetical protein
MSKKVIIPTAVLVGLAAVGLFGIKSIGAVGNGHSPLAEKIANRFGLNKDEVEAVFEEDRTQRQDEMKARYEDRLNQAVSDGKITEEQKQAVVAKKAELQENRQEMANLSDEERKQKMDEHRQEMETWAEENGIDLGLFMGRGGFGDRGLGMGR